MAGLVGMPAAAVEAARIAEVAALAAVVAGFAYPACEAQT